MAKKTIWIVLISLSLSLIITGTIFVLVKKYKGERTIETVKLISSKTPAAKPKEETKLVWIARLSASRQQIEEAANMHLNQAANDKIEVDAISPFIRTETKIKFSYKKRGKLHEAVLTRDNTTDEYYYGIVDLSDNTQLELWLKEDGLEKYKGNARQMIKVGGKIIYAPSITASLEKEEIIISSK